MTCLNYHMDDPVDEIKRLPLNTTHRPINVVLHWHREGMLNLDAPYQRGDVWGNTRRVNLMRSVLRGIPIPSIIINDRHTARWIGDDSYAVIDGKQRVTTLLMFLTNQLPIPGEWLGMNGMVTYDQLPVVKQRKIKMHALAFSEGQLKTIEEEIEVFELVNYGGVAQGDSDE